jgi:hypothetical protein
MLLDPNDSRRCMQPLALSFLNKVERCKKKWRKDLTRSVTKVQVRFHFVWVRAGWGYNLHEGQRAGGSASRHQVCAMITATLPKRFTRMEGDAVRPRRALQFLTVAKVLFYLDFSSGPIRPRTLLRVPAWGGPARPKSNGPMVANPTPPGRYIIYGVETYRTQTWPYSRIPWGTRLLDKPELKDIWYEFRPGAHGAMARSRAKISSMIITSSTAKNQCRPPGSSTISDR